MSARSTDIIRWVIDRMMAHEDSITQELALTVEREARAEWGGQQVGYIAMRCAGDGGVNAEAVRRDLAQPGRPAREVAQRHGISRATLYRLIKRD